MTEVSSIDLANPGNEPRSTAILGDANTVYANADSLYVAANAWVEPPFFWYDQGGPIASSGGSTVASPPNVASPPAAWLGQRDRLRCPRPRRLGRRRFARSMLRRRR